MPVTPTSAYQPVSNVLALARTIIDDAYSSSGQIMTGTTPGPAAPMTYSYINSALRFLQRRLRNAGVETFVKETIITPLTATPLNDQAAQVSLSDAGYFDGQDAIVNPPQLPIDLVVPQVIWQRPTGSVGSWGEPIPQANDGLPALPITQYFRAWEWRNDTLFFTGQNQSLDIRLRYMALLNPVASDSDPLPIRDGVDAVAYLTAWQYCMTSGDPMIAEKIEQAAMAIIKDMTTSNTRRQQRGSHRRQSWRRGRGTGYGFM